MSNFDPVNNRNHFEKVLNDIYNYERLIDMKKYLKNLGKKKNIDDDVAKMDYCQTAIENYLAQWDAAKTEEERKAVIGSVTGPNI